MSKLVGPAIAVLLLGLYVYATWIVCARPDAAPTGPALTILSLVGALLSALVISVLATTDPGRSPATALMLATGRAPANRASEVVVPLYLVVWLGCGVALLVTWLRDADALPVVAEAAKSWLGLALGAGYAYLGLKPPGRTA